MADNLEEMAVLELLRQQEQKLQLTEIIEKLGAEYPERSLRRWLTELEQEKLIRKTGAKRGVKYQAIEQISTFFSPSSMHTLEKVRRPLYERLPVVYDDRWIEEIINPTLLFTYLPQ